MSFEPFVTEIEYTPDASAYFAQLHPLKHPIWLDSCHPATQSGRYDIFAACPSHYLQTFADSTQVDTYSCASGLTKSNTKASHQCLYRQDPFEVLARHLPTLNTKRTEHECKLPIYGGALGFWGYDLARYLVPVKEQIEQTSQLPDMAVGLYPWTLVLDHTAEKAYISAVNKASTEAITGYLSSQNNLKSILENGSNPFIINKFESNLNAKHYFEKFDIIQNHIREGDCYQVNFAQRFSSQYKGDPLTAYLHLRAINPAPFAAFIPLEKGAILSLSPERFIAAQQDKVTTSPIKGTAARKDNLKADQLAGQQLLDSPKDQAENLMIVDLLRNDLSQTCRHVKVPQLFELQSFTNVHHLVSTIEAQLKSGQSCVDVLRSAFPGGSITGAPKIRAMEVIESLESHRRGPYCGSIGYISHCGNMDTNIAIRTLVAEDHEISCWGGGGIVADSEAESEYNETLAKVDILLRALEGEFPAPQQ
ncbi:aminodeoxychorismate synthase component I [Gilvimarinus sp. 1_MG-2023]|uniref:aminodeoxychorismate synthase component I n=1 Tax=Gilvimarinus sp. 1_MG-2023 TaxID=3062638 RepID=UPI0026E3AD51|nr:aminodeoxychorismate synthase component I [Gilvimarinus sp. 1_MG-2023]MDO6745824.1 aminodeoxychorismate synthase component I [Gilvimarinus sp. 1_MG-2023]